MCSLNFETIWYMNKSMFLAVTVCIMNIGSWQIWTDSEGSLDSSNMIRVSELTEEHLAMLVYLAITENT